ncbi:hypothetical protein B0J14DRAFT_487121 [Halenospora varia]|nr:hypothetical protein B0J14DRAFT_487121 [Halenospora varia]
MNSGQYRRRHQMNNLPLTFPYVEGSPTSIQSAHQIPSFHPLHQMQVDRQFMISPPTIGNIPSNNNFGLTNPMSAMPQSSTLWNSSNHTQLSVDDQSPGNYYGYSTSMTSNEQDNTLSRGIDYAEVPRTWTSYDPRMLTDNNMSVDGVARFDAMDNSRGFSRSPNMEDDLSNSNLLAFSKSTSFRLPSIEDSDDGGQSSREMTAMEVDEHSVDEPYAKLIYRALISAPNHSMVLQEIYQWFRENTTKGSQDTKGWMNSIRHNLSMNAAFKKTERKIAGDDTKKSTEWVLEDFAIKDGVQSTTRYRKGTSAKKFTRSEHPAPARQRSGRKGGISASKTKLHRQRAREERSDPRRPIQRHDILRSQYLQPRSHPTQRQSSPLTPPSHEGIPSSSPYFFPKTKHIEIPFEDVCRLENVQGVDNDSPLFSHGDYDSLYDGLPRYQ